MALEFAAAVRWKGIIPGMAGLCLGLAIIAAPANGQIQPVPANTQTEAAKPAPEKKASGCEKNSEHAGENCKTVKRRVKKKTDQHPSSHPPATQTAKDKDEDQPPKTIVRHGGAADPTLQIAPVESEQQQAQTSRSTSELLQSTDQNLKQIEGRELTEPEKEMVGQIRNYVSQATSAQKLGDVERAQSFASKAKQLSDDMVKH